MGYSNLIEGRDRGSMGASGTHRIAFLSSAFVLTFLLQDPSIQSFLS